MKEYRLAFMVSVQSDLDFDDFLIQLEQEWSAFERVTPRTFKMGDKWVEVQKNHLYDPDLASNPANGYIHYRYRITVDPENVAQFASEGSSDLTQWIDFAKSLKSRLEEMGYLAEIVAEYERLLDE